MKTSYRFPAGFVSPEKLLATQVSTDTTPHTAAETAPGSILVGFSGGADSVALLDALSVWAQASGAVILAGHVNHGIRGEEAIRDREFCREFCRRRDIPFLCADADVPGERLPGESLETAARRVRYDRFGEWMRTRGIPYLALAHHADDNLETVLFRLCRGTGLRGLCGIPPARPFAGGMLLRPFLGVSREEILRYCSERGLDYVTDSTNSCPDAARNRIRLQAVPALRQISGDLCGAVTRMTSLLFLDRSYLDQQTDELIRACDATCDPAHPVRLSRSHLNGAHPAIASRALLRLIEAAGADPGAVHVDAMLDFLRTSAPHGVFPLPGGIRLDVVYDTVTAQPAPREEALPLPPDGEAVPLIPGVPVRFGQFEVLSETMTYRELCRRYGQDAFSRKNPRPDTLPSHTDPNVFNFFIQIPIRSDTISHDVYLRPRRPNDRILSCGMHKDVRRLLSARRVPPALRDRLPILCDSDGILAVPFAEARDATFPDRSTPDDASVLLCTVRTLKGNDLL